MPVGFGLDLQVPGDAEDSHQGLEENVACVRIDREALDRELTGQVADVRCARTSRPFDPYFSIHSLLSP